MLILLIEPCSADQLNLAGTKPTPDEISLGNLPTIKSTIVDSDGSSCMGEDKSRKQTVLAALAEAKRKAVEFVSTHVSSETQVVNSELEQDRISAYAHAEVKTLQEIENVWYRDPTYGDCYKTKIKVEIIPSAKPVELMDKKQEFAAQENCSKQAKNFYDDYFKDGFTGSEIIAPGFISHYNTKLNLCFIWIQYLMTIKGADEKIFTNQDVFDAVSRKVYASYSWSTVEGKKYWEVKPTVCEMLDKKCVSQEEFESFAKSFM